ncbi:MAG TPA: NRDE family protein [Thermoguttaceae bacterium]|nr:NRDE family protein [Thermoguttaceae bacterium]
MCILALLYKTAKNTPILLAANREERFDRPSQPPKIQSGSPRVVCGIDRKEGGTWLGVNQHGLLATVTNRRKRNVPMKPRSRGLLCRELLAVRTAKEAAQHAASELATGAYDGANYVVADAEYGAVVYGGDTVEIVELTPGLHVLTNGKLDDYNDERQEFVRRMLTLHTLDSAVTFLAVVSRAFGRKPDKSGRRGVVQVGSDVGTVSSTLLSLSDRIQQAVFQYAPGPPCDKSYDDLSALLRQVLSTDRKRREKEEEEDDDLLLDDIDAILGSSDTSEHAAD